MHETLLREKDIHVFWLGPSSSRPSVLALRLSSGASRSPLLIVDWRREEGEFSLKLGGLGLLSSLNGGGGAGAGRLVIFEGSTLS